MANFTELNTIITDLFGVLSTLIGEVVTLITGDLLVLSIVSAFIALIVGIIFLIFNNLKGVMGSSVKMRK